MDKTAQMHAIEIILAAVIFFTAMNFALTLSVPIPQEKFSIEQWKIYGEDALRNLDNTQLNNSTEQEIYHNSTLTKYIITNDVKNLTEFLNKTLPQSVSYNVYNGSKQFYFKDVPIGGDIVIVHRLIVFNGEVYDIRLEIWEEYR